LTKCLIVRKGQKNNSGSDFAKLDCGGPKL
jgi:hypothetical protein